MKGRRVVSLLLMLSILGMLVSSIVLYIVPQGRVAHWSGWTLLGLSKSQWGAVHTNLGFLMLVAGAFHLYLNWRPMTSYLKDRAKRFRLFTPNFNVAFVVFGVFTVLTILELPPASWIQGLRVSLEENGARTLGEPPYGHAEESSLRVFLRNTGLDGRQARANLQLAGLSGIDPEASILQISRANGLTPQELFEIMRGPEGQHSSGPVPFPASMPMGSGRLTLAAFCAQYNRDVNEAVRVLEAAGWSIDPKDTLKNIAASNGREGLDLLDVLREGMD